MNERPPLLISSWAAWTPGLFSKESWKDFFERDLIDLQRPDPVLTECPPLMRRRMSRINQMAAVVGLACCREAGVLADQVSLVLASRHGEMATLTEILSKMAQGEPVSPTRFSHSVHHTAGSHLSLITKNKYPLRSIAGGEASFAYGFWDALGLLREKESGGRVLFIAVDDEVPEFFKPLLETGADDPPHAVGLLLASPSMGKGTSLRFLGAETASCALSPRGDPPAIQFLRGWLSNSRTVEMNAGGRIWRWAK